MINYVNSIILVIFKGKFQPIWLLRCATCSNVTVWTRVCMAPMTQFHIWLRTWQTKGHTAREQLHTAVQQPPPGTASISTWLTYILKCRVKVRQGTAAEFWQQKISTNCHSAIPLIAHDMISAPASQAFVERLFSVCGLLTVGRRNRMDKSLNMRAWLKVNYDELQDLL